MSIVHKITRTWSRGNDQITRTESVTVEAEITIDTSVAASTSDALHAFVLDVSQAKTIFLLSSQDLTVETNSSSAPAATVSLKAGIPRQWSTGSGETNPFGSTDVTALYLTNGTLAAADVQIRVGFDPTV